MTPIGIDRDRYPFAVGDAVRVDDGRIGIVVTVPSPDRAYAEVQFCDYLSAIHWTRLTVERANANEGEHGFRDESITVDVAEGVRGVVLDRLGKHGIRGRRAQQFADAIARHTYNGIEHVLRPDTIAKEGTP